jgi:hypothetical protein
MDLHTLYKNRPLTADQNFISKGPIISVFLFLRKLEK